MVLFKSKRTHRIIKQSFILGPNTEWIYDKSFISDQEQSYVSNIPGFSVTSKNYFGIGYRYSFLCY